MPRDVKTMMYAGMVLTVEIVTPSIASDLLKRNGSNRKMRDAVVAQYKRDMERGAWVPIPVAICIDRHGNLGNGQHRLQAIVESGCEQEMLICRETPAETIAAMDVGAKRTVNDVANFLGADFEKRKASIAKILKWGPKGTDTRSFHELLEAYTEHEDAIDFICSIAPRAGGFTAPVLAVCAKASKTCDRQRIKRFIEILKTGVTNGPNESAVIRLREQLHSTRGAGGQKPREEMYSKTMSALDCFLRGKPMAKLYGTSVDLFPATRRNRHAA